MKDTDTVLYERIKALLSSQPLAVLSTQRNGQPYSSLMAFAFTDDLRSLVVATGASTRKHQNIVMDSRVSLLVDNRSHREEDFHAAAAVTILGTARRIDAGERAVHEQLYLKRHPYLQQFCRSPTTNLFQISVSHYIMVTRFQSVMEYHIADDIDLFS
jgi:nitroimidazol reductase NimA-like FMN-containing flavoprotein (pyridoxamine 5'-phosphate oxidase superfamily)